jgi:hypothetical protein
MLGWIKYLRGVRVETNSLDRNKNFASTRTPHSLVRDEGGRRFKSCHSDQYLADPQDSYPDSFPNRFSSQHLFGRRRSKLAERLRRASPISWQ